MHYSDGLLNSIEAHWIGAEAKPVDCGSLLPPWRWAACCPRRGADNGANAPPHTQQAAASAQRQQAAVVHGAAAAPPAPSQQEQFAVYRTVPSVSAGFIFAPSSPPRNHAAH